jgi:hypothetical protein
MVGKQESTILVVQNLSGNNVFMNAIGKGNAMTSLSPRSEEEQATSLLVVSHHVLFLRIFLAACMVLTPLVTLLYVVLNPTALGAKTGRIALALTMAANSTTNELTLILGTILSFLFPLAFLGMAWLAMRRAPWLATIAGLLSLVGWIPWSALNGQGALTYIMVQMGGGTQFATLWDRFNNDWVITTYSLIYIIGHLLSAVLLGIALGRTHLIPVWAAWAIALTSPLQMVAFIVHVVILIDVACLIWFIASIPTALALLQTKDLMANGKVVY